MLNLSFRADGRGEVGRAGSHDGSGCLTQVPSKLLLEVANFFSHLLATSWASLWLSLPVEKEVKASCAVEKEVVEVLEEVVEVRVAP